MTDTHSHLMRQAKQAIETKQMGQARQLLHQIIQNSPGDHRAWAWLAALAPSTHSGLDYIRRAEKLAPDDPFVQKVRGWLDKKTSLPVPSPVPQTAAELDSQATPDRRSWQTAVIWGSIITLIVLLLGLGGLGIWSWLTQPKAAAAETAVLVQPQAPQPATNTAVSDPVVVDTPQPVSVNNSEEVHAPAKNIAASGSEKNAPRPTWTPTPKPTNTPVPTPSPIPTFVNPNNPTSGKRPLGVGPNERWVDVNLTTQTLVAYEGDIPVLTTLISSGTWDHPTVTGQFRVWLRYESQTMDGRRLGYDYYLEDVPYVMYFYEDYALHGTYWHNNFGTPMSHGCVNMSIPDAEFVFYWSTIGTVVNVHY